MKHFCKAKNKNMVSEKKRMKMTENLLLEEEPKNTIISPNVLEKYFRKTTKIQKNKILCKYCSCEFTTEASNVSPYEIYLQKV